MTILELSTTTHNDKGKVVPWKPADLKYDFERGTIKIVPS